MTTPAVLRLADVLGRPVLRVEDDVRTWQDARDELVADAASWRELEQGVARGEATHRLADDTGAGLDPTAEHEGVVRWRRERRLLAADDLRAWLAWWGMDIRSWRRALRRLAWADTLLAEQAEAVPVDEGVVWEHVVVTGVVEEAARRLGERLAVRALLRDLGRASADGVDRPEADEAALRDLVVTPRAIARHVSAHRLDWVRLGGTRLQVVGRDRAREARLCLAHDGAAAADVARLAHTAAEPLDALAADLEPALRSALLGAVSGQVVGPTPVGPPEADLHAVVLLAGKTIPSTTDPVVHARATADLVGAARHRAVQERVHWCDGWNDHG